MDRSIKDERDRELDAILEDADLAVFLLQKLLDDNPHPFADTRWHFISAWADRFLQIRKVNGRPNKKGAVRPKITP